MTVVQLTPCKAMNFRTPTHEQSYLDRKVNFNTIPNTINCHVPLIRKVAPFKIIPLKNDGPTIIAFASSVFEKEIKVCILKSNDSGQGAF